MKFDDFDAKMRRFEKGFDDHAPDTGFLVARLDGRGFTKLTKDKIDYKRPFDERFHKAMNAVCMHLMNTGFNLGLCYCQSDEISLLFHTDDTSFDHKTRKLLSILAGEASAVFSIEIGMPASFDCRLCPLPDAETVVDYFRWRAEDAKRNALNAFCYWKLRELGKSPSDASAQFSRRSKEDKLGFLLENGVDFEGQEDWKRLGSLLVYESKSHTGINPKTNQATEVMRNKLISLSPTPQGADLSKVVGDIVNGMRVEPNS